MVIHGGFWRSTYGRGLMDGLAEDLAARGWAAWNLDRGGDRWRLGEVEYDKERYPSPWAYAQERAIADGWQLVAQFRDDGTFYLLAPYGKQGVIVIIEQRLFCFAAPLAINPFSHQEWWRILL